MYPRLKKNISLSFFGLKFAIALIAITTAMVKSSFQNISNWPKSVGYPHNGGYSHNLTEKSLLEVGVVGRQVELQPKKKMPFVTTYHPLVCNFKTVQ